MAAADEDDDLRFQLVSDLDSFDDQGGFKPIGVTGQTAFSVCFLLRGAHSSSPGSTTEDCVRRLIIMAALATLVASASGCRMVRATEQWKCDNLGLCLFGMRPSNSQPCPCENTAEPEFSIPVR